MPFWLWLQKWKYSKKFDLSKKNRFCWRVWKLCKTEGMRIYSTMKETIAAFAERTTRSLKNIFYRYMEGYGNEYFRRRYHFFTTLAARKKLFDRLDTKEYQKFRFFSTQYSKPLREYREPTFKIGDSVCISKNDLPFRKRYNSQFVPEVFAFFIRFSSRKSPKYTIKDDLDEFIRGKFYHNFLINAI